MKNVYPKTAHTFSSGRLLFSYFLCLNYYKFSTALENLNKLYILEIAFQLLKTGQSGHSYSNPARNKDEILFRLIFETEIHILIYVSYFKSLPIATYYLTTIHIKKLYLLSETYNMDLKPNLYLTSLFCCGPIDKSVNPNFQQYQSNRSNDIFNCLVKIQS